MNRYRLIRSLAIVLLVLLALPVAAEAAGRAASISGQLVSFSTAARSLTIKAAGGQQTVLRVNPASRLLRNGAPVRLAGLALRDSVTAQFERNTLRVISLRARGPAVETTRGGLLGVDAALRTLSVGTPAGPREFQLVRSTLFVRNGRPATAGDLTSRDALLVHSLPAANGAAVAADVEADGPEEEEVEGEISAIAGSDVTITPKQGKEVTVHVDDSTVIRLHLPHGERTEGTLADLEVGMEAEAEFDPVSFVAFKIDAEQEEDDEEEEEEAHVKGTVSAVDGGAGTITIEPRTGSPVTLEVDGSTKIELNGDSAPLGDIPVGAKAEAEYDAATNVASKIEAETEDEDDEEEEEEPAEVEGEVTAISATSITIAPEHSGAPVTLAIDADTVILIDHEPGTAADIEVGDEAEAKYDADTKVALRIKVEDEDEEEDD